MQFESIRIRRERTPTPKDAPATSRVINEVKVQFRAVFSLLRDIMLPQKRQMSRTSDLLYYPKCLERNMKILQEDSAVIVAEKTSKKISERMMPSRTFAGKGRVNRQRGSSYRKCAYQNG